MFPNPFSTWLAMVQGARLMSETIEASGTVVAARSRTIGAAIADPLGADTTELTRMIEEKTASLAAAGASLASGWWRM